MSQLGSSPLLTTRKKKKKSPKTTRAAIKWQSKIARELVETNLLLELVIVGK
jgi:hypothetical protein